MCTSQEANKQWKTGFRDDSNKPFLLITLFSTVQQFHINLLLANELTDSTVAKSSFSSLQQKNANASGKER